MKRGFLVAAAVLAAALALLACPAPAGACASAPSDFSIGGDGTITGYSGGPDVTVPAEVGGVEVADIGDGAFMMSGIRSLSFKDGCRLTRIGDDAFCQCAALRGDVVLPDSVVSVGARAFMWCGGLGTVALGPNVEELGGCAFQSCSASVSVSEGNACFRSAGGLLTTGDGRTLLHADIGWQAPRSASVPSCESPFSFNRDVSSGRCPMEGLEPLNEAVAKSMRSNRRRDTGPELALRRALREAGRPGYRLQWKVPGRPDIAYPGRRTAVFVNGCFWHRCPRCALPMPAHNRPYWEAKFRRNAERDRRAAEELEAAGWDVVVVWECEIRDDLPSCVRRVAASLDRPRPPRRRPGRGEC